MSAVFVNFLVFGVNFLATAASVFLLGCFGRKSLMTIFSAAQAVCLVLLGAFLGPLASDDGGNTLPIIFCLMFVAFFEFSSGPITWLYLAEICNDVS